MAGTVYTQLLVDESHSGDLSTTYTVPEGFRAVIRDIAAFTANASAPGGVVIQSTTTNAYLFYESTPAAVNTYVHWEGRQVVEPGDGLEITVYADTGGSIRITGYLLTLP